MNYKKEYLKYKQKYLNLKYENNVGGAFKKIAGCEPIINSKGEITLLEKEKFNTCIQEQKKTGNNNEYFIIFNFYQNIENTLDTSICEILNNIIFNMNIKPENIYLLTQYIDKTKIDMDYDDYRKINNDRLIYSSINWKNRCEYFMELIKNNKINHLMCNEKKTVTNYEDHVKEKINDIIKLLNDKIKSNKQNAKINLSITSHGDEISDFNEKFISLDGSNNMACGLQLSNFYNYMEILFKNDNISIIVFLPTFCFNTLFRKFLIKKIKSDTSIKNKKIHFYSIEPNIRIIKLISKIKDYEFLTSSVSGFIDYLKQNFKDKNDSNKVNFIEYFNSSYYEDGTGNRITISVEENNLLNIFIAQYNELDNFDQHYGFCKSQTYSQLLEAGSLSLIVELYTDYNYNYNINMDKERVKNDFINKMTNYIISSIGHKLSFKENNTINNNFFNSEIFKNYIKENLVFIKSVEK
jgi:hypothetical protein